MTVIVLRLAGAPVTVPCMTSHYSFTRIVARLRAYGLVRRDQLVELRSFRGWHPEGMSWGAFAADGTDLRVSGTDSMKDTLASTRWQIRVDEETGMTIVSTL